MALLDDLPARLRELSIKPANWLEAASDLAALSPASEVGSTVSRQVLMARLPIGAPEIGPPEAVSTAGVPAILDLKAAIRLSAILYNSRSLAEAAGGCRLEGSGDGSAEESVRERSCPSVLGSPAADRAATTYFGR